MKHLRMVSKSNSEVVVAQETTDKSCEDLSTALKVFNFVSPIPGFSNIATILGFLCESKEPEVV